VNAAKSPTRLAILLGFATIYLVWGTTYLGIRVAVEGIPPFFLAASRFLFGGSLLYGMLRLRGRPRPERREWIRQSVPGLCLVGANAVVCWAELKVPSGLSALAVGVAPICMVTIGWAMPGGKPPSRTIWTGILIGLVGLFILFGPGAFPAGLRPPIVNVLALFASSAVWCLGSIQSKRSGSQVEPLLGAAMQMFVGGAAMALCSFAFGEHPLAHLPAVTASSWVAAAYLTVFGSLLAFPTYIWLLKHESPARISSYAYVNPTVALVAGWLFLHETVPARSLAAVPLILGGIAVITYGTSPRRAVEPIAPGKASPPTFPVPTSTVRPNG
jgi:drug/metabolite transporter (DMT)-like permease